MTNIIKGSVAGILAGIFLGLFFKFIETVTGLKVYTLLLNVDYVPVIKDYKPSEFKEFFLHLVISVVLSLLILKYLQNKDWSVDRKWKFVVNIAFFIGLLLYPSTILSDRTPAITSTYSFLFWMIGHLLYGAVLGKLLISKRG